MIERGKDDGDMGKFQKIIMGTGVAAVLIFLAPTLVLILTGAESTDESALFEGPKKMIKVCSTNDGGTPDNDSDDTETCEMKAEGGELLPSKISSGLSNIWLILMWFFRIVLLISFGYGLIGLRIANTKVMQSHTAQNIAGHDDQKTLCLD